MCIRNPAQARECAAGLRVEFATKKCMQGTNVGHMRRGNVLTNRRRRERREANNFHKTVLTILLPVVNHLQRTVGREPENTPRKVIGRRKLGYNQGTPPIACPAEDLGVVRIAVIPFEGLSRLISCGKKGGYCRRADL
jgi:hypothetical protein